MGAVLNESAPTVGRFDVPIAEPSCHEFDDSALMLAERFLDRAAVTRGVVKAGANASAKAGDEACDRPGDKLSAKATDPIAKPLRDPIQETWTWRQVHQAAIEFAPRIAGAGAVCNLCSSRLAFLVTALAALRSGVLLVLPPSGGSVAATVASSASGPMVFVVDDAQAMRAEWLTSREPNEQATGVLCQPMWQPSSVDAADLAWQPRWDAASIVLHTSGSTGAPLPQAKTLRQLSVGARVLGARLSQWVPGGLVGIEQLISSVPAQHMFGMEASVMLSLVHGIPVLDARPLLPADVQQAFAASPSSAWIATPAHLRGLAQAGVELANCAAVISSTMSLSQGTAQRAQALVHAPVLEIYGSTETGALAMRRSATEEDWLPLRDVHIEPVSGSSGGSPSAASIAVGAHFTSPWPLSDQIEPVAGGRFRLLGRESDLIKVGGRRASLAGLNLLLQDVPGLDDGTFYLPTVTATDEGTSAEATVRLCLIYSGATLDRAALLRHLRTRIDPLFLPRSVIHVERLPRGDNGKLARQALDELYAAWQGGRHSAAPSDAVRVASESLATSSIETSRGFHFVIAPDHAALPGHFPGRPIVPGVLLLDEVIIGVEAASNRRVQALKQVKFAAALLPGEQAQVVFDVTNDSAQFSVDVQRGDERVLLANGSLRLAPAHAPHDKHDVRDMPDTRALHEPHEPCNTLEPHDAHVTHKPHRTPTP
ncbi:MAG: long-chain fatty acid--CoA ligase [Rhizobacter sp.]|nr:long-chain fatty acid--CoA ligase [Rhizobacter sp.]